LKEGKSEVILDSEMNYGGEFNHGEDEKKTKGTSLLVGKNLE